MAGGFPPAEGAGGVSEAPPLRVDVVIPFRGWDAWTAESARAALAGK